MFIAIFTGSLKARRQFVNQIEATYAVASTTAVTQGRGTVRIETAHFGSYQWLTATAVNLGLDTE
jgi:hypothetical protein